MIKEFHPFKDMIESAKNQHEVDKANFALAKAESKANFEENRFKNSYKRAKETFNESLAMAKLSPKEREEMMQAEREKKLAEINEKIALAEERYNKAK